jgi:ribose/xylose/arabinose/galactoside ABC-type transport system permease subunit
MELTLLIITKGLRPDFCAAAWRIIQQETGIKIVAAIFTMCFAIYPLVTLSLPVIGLLCKAVEGNSAASRMAGIGPE